MQTRSPLFRAAAVAARRRDGFGEIVIVRPVSFTMLSVAALGIAAAVAALLAFGTYTRHSTLAGRLLPDRGVIEVQTPQPGTVVERRVTEGVRVARGDVLYVVSSERFSSARGATQQRIGEELELRRASLESEIENLARLEDRERALLAESIAMLRVEIEGLDAMIAGGREQLGLAEDAAARYARIERDGFASKDQLLAREQERLEQRARLQSFERERRGVVRQLAELESRTAAIEIEYRNRVAELERGIAGTELEIAENEARRRIEIVAPQSGIATAIAAEIGQVVDRGAPLALIVPAGATLEAHLYAPSRAVGFVDVGDEVLLRYAAYPYQKFGHHRGTVAAVSEAPLGSVDDMHGGAPADTVYRVIVALDSQTVSLYGVAHPLRAGMALEADVLHETRRLYEWALEPLYTLRGRVH